MMSSFFITGIVSVLLNHVTKRDLADWGKTKLVYHRSPR